MIKKKNSSCMTRQKDSLNFASKSNYSHVLLNFKLKLITLNIKKFQNDNSIYQSINWAEFGAHNSF